MTYQKIKLNDSILVLNSDYNPIHIASGRRAVVLLLKEKAQFISEKVIRLLHYVRLPFARLMANKPTRAMIHRRDSYCCSYCGAMTNLTIDHVLPTSRGGKDSWENMTTACNRCNVKKGNRTPEEANMPLYSQPKRPFNKLHLTVKTANVQEWQEYVYG